MRGETGMIKRKRSRYEEGTEMRGKKGDMRGEKEQEMENEGERDYVEKKKEELSLS